MTVIKVPRPKGVMNPNRPTSSLLLAHVRHLYEAEQKLPMGSRGEHYINAIRTEGEAADYIRHVTEAIHRAHSDAATRRMSAGGKKKEKK